MARLLALVLLLGCALTSGDVGARDRSIRAEFHRLNPCPANSLRKGPCPGYQVDHREALVCGGKDRLDNLQWLSVEEHKAKTRVEVKLCRANR